MPFSIPRLLRLYFCIFLSSPLVFYGQNSKDWTVLNYFSKKPIPISFSLFRGQPAPTKDLLALLGRQAQWDQLGQAGLNLQRPTLSFKKISQTVSPGGQVAERYRVFAEGAPANKIFAFGFWPVAKNFLLDPSNIYADPTAPRDVYVNAQGLLMLRPPKPEQDLLLESADEVDVTLTTDSAEPMRFLLDSMDGKLQIFGTLVPHPVVSDDQGCRLEVRIAQTDAKAVLVILDRFPAKERIPLVLESADQVVNEVLTTDSSGHAVIADFPFVPGTERGTLKATAEGPKCLPSVTLPWGPSSQPAPKTP